VLSCPALSLLITRNVAISLSPRPKLISQHNMTAQWISYLCALFRHRFFYLHKDTVDQLWCTINSLLVSTRFFLQWHTFCLLPYFIKKYSLWYCHVCLYIYLHTKEQQLDWLTLLSSRLCSEYVRWMKTNTKQWCNCHYVPTSKSFLKLLICTPGTLS
jgi:hypothetical protein